MVQNITTSCRTLVEVAEREIETITADQARALSADEAIFIDIRDIRELAREGRMPGAVHCPRDILEFSIDPASRDHKPVFAEDKKFIFFCAGGMRSALAALTAHRMGLRPVAHLSGGFGAWRAAGGAVEASAPDTLARA